MRKDEDGMLELIHEDEFETIVPMIGIMAGMDLRSVGNYSSSDSSEELVKKKNVSNMVSNALTVAFLRKGRSAGMKEVYDVLIEMRIALVKSGLKPTAELAEHLIHSLSQYGTESGPFFAYYNGSFSINMDNWFFILEQEELVKKGALLEVVCYGVLQRIAQICFLEENRSYPKMVVLDEAAPLLKSELFIHYLDDFARRLRKYYAGITIVTQYISDFHHNKRAKSLYAGMSYGIYLEHEHSKIESLDNDGLLNFGEFEKELFKSLRKTPSYSEFLFKHRDISIVGRLKVSSTEAALYTTNPKDRKFREELMKKHGISKSDSLYYLQN